MNVIQTMLDHGYGFNVDTLGDLIQERLQEVSRVNPRRRHPTWDNNRPVNNFIYSFARRHNLKYKNTLELTNNNVQVSTDAVLLWFRDTQHRLLSDPVFAEIYQDPRQAQFSVVIEN